MGFGYLSFLGSCHILCALHLPLLIFAKFQKIQSAYFTSELELRPQFTTYWHMVYIKNPAQERRDAFYPVPKMGRCLEFLAPTVPLEFCSVL